MIFKFSTPFRFVAACARVAYAKLFGYAALAPFEIADDRLTKCYGCDELRVDTNQCVICTCDVEAKTILALEQCPKEKWKRVWIKKRTV